MNRSLIYPGAVLSLLISASPILLQLETGFGFLAGVGLILSLILKKKTERAILRQGRNRNRKMMESFMEAGVPLVGIGTASLATPVPGSVGVFSLAAVSISMVYRREISFRLSKNYSYRMGEKVWLGITAAGILLTVSNSYFMFYAVFLTGLAAVADLVEFSWRIQRD